MQRCSNISLRENFKGGAVTPAVPWFVAIGSAFFMKAVLPHKGQDDYHIWIILAQC